MGVAPMQFDALKFADAVFNGMTLSDALALYVDSDDSFDSQITPEVGNNGRYVGTIGADYFADFTNTSDEIFGDLGNDYLKGGSGDDDLYGESGNDIIEGDSRSIDLWNGGEGFDVFLDWNDGMSFQTQTWVHDLEAGVSKGLVDVEGPFDSMVSLEGVIDLLKLHHQIVGNSADNILITGEGDDTFFGGIGNDKIRGGEGTDTARYTNARSEYVVTTETGPEGQTLYRVTSLDQTETGEGSDLLFSDIELLEFAGEVMTIEDALVPVSAVTEGQYSLTAIANVFGSIMFLDGLTETVTSTSHTIEYNGTTFDYAEVDGIITTVVRDGEFTSEFAAEIAESFPNSAGISYSTAVALIGQANMESTLMMVAGADGNYVG